MTGISRDSGKNYTVLGTLPTGGDTETVHEEKNFGLNIKLYKLISEFTTYIR